MLHLSRSTAVALGATALSLCAPQTGIAQGRCGGDRAGTPACDTSAIAAPFAPTGWKTVSLDHFTVRAADYKREAAYYMALMNWTLRSDDGTKAILDAGSVGQVWIIGGYEPPAPPTPPAGAPPAAPPAGAAAGGGVAGGGGGRTGGGFQRAPRKTVWESYAWVIAPWDAKKVEAELKARGLAPVSVVDGASQCFLVKDPDGMEVGLCNDARIKARKGSAPSPVPAPFEKTTWQTVWLDHISFQASNYKESAAWYHNLLGWRPTGDEGSQNEMEIGADIGNIIVRGGNPLAPGFTPPSPRRAQMDHVSFGIAGFEPVAVKAELDKRGLTGRADTGGRGDILDPKVAYKSYHTTTPDGFDLQISNANKGTRTVR